MPGAPLFRRTATHARHSTSLRLILSYSAWNLRPGPALAARYSACCKARTGSPATGDPFTAGLALTALTGPLLHLTRTDEAAAFPSPAVLLSARLNQYYGRLRRPPGQRSTSRFQPVIGRHAPAAGIRRLPGRGGPPQFPPPPSIRSAPHTPGSPSRLRFQALRRFHGLRPDFERLGTPFARPEGRLSNDAAGFASCCGPHRRSPYRASDAGLRPGPVSRPSRQPATGPPGSYPDRTSTGRRRRAYEHEETPWHYVTVSPPALLGARKRFSVRVLARHRLVRVEIRLVVDQVPAEPAIGVPFKAERLQPFEVLVREEPVRAAGEVGVSEINAFAELRRQLSRPAVDELAETLVVLGVLVADVRGN